MGKVERAGDRTFVANLDKDVIKRYPEFHPQSFEAMTDDEVSRYEWRVVEAIDPAGARSSMRDWSYDRPGRYERPSWFNGSAIRTASQRRATGRDARSTREVPEREGVVAHDQTSRERSSGEPPRERVRGSKDNLT